MQLGEVTQRFIDNQYRLRAARDPLSGILGIVDQLRYESALKKSKKRAAAAGEETGAMAADAARGVGMAVAGVPNVPSGRTPSREALDWLKEPGAAEGPATATWLKFHPEALPQYEMGKAAASEKRQHELDLEARREQTWLNRIGAQSEGRQAVEDTKSKARIQYGNLMAEAASLRNLDTIESRERMKQIDYELGALRAQLGLEGTIYRADQQLKGTEATAEARRDVAGIAADASMFGAGLRYEGGILSNESRERIGAARDAASITRTDMQQQAATARTQMQQLGASERTRQTIEARSAYLDKDQQFKAAEAVKRADERVQLENVKLGGQIELLGEKAKLTPAAQTGEALKWLFATQQAGASTNMPSLFDTAETLARASQQALQQGNVTAAQETAKLARTMGTLAKAAQTAQEEDDQIEKSAIHDYWQAVESGTSHAKAMQEIMVKYGHILPPKGRRRVEMLKDYSAEPSNVLSRASQAMSLARKMSGPPAMEQAFTAEGMNEYKRSLLTTAADLLHEAGDLPARNAIAQGKLGYQDLVQPQAPQDTGEPPPLLPEAGATNAPPPLLPPSTAGTNRVATPRRGKVGKFTWEAEPD